jgi:hypothetical protein
VGAQPENRYAPWATGDVYLNFIGDEGHDRTVAGYGPENYQRLARIKAEFDPDNIFSRWHNVNPTAMEIPPPTPGDPLRHRTSADPDSTNRRRIQGSTGSTAFDPLGCLLCPCPRWSPVLPPPRRTPRER